MHDRDHIFSADLDESSNLLYFEPYAMY